jgi:UTP--glucose-1-phosphate uridylyltransferase
LLPVFDRPGIEWICQEAVDSGVDNLVLVSSPDKPNLSAHFEQDAELESQLTNKPELLARVQRSSSYKVTTCFQYQPKGLGHAVACAADLVGDEPFAVMLPDDLILGTPPALSALVQTYEQSGKSVVLLQEVPREETHRYGIVSGTVQDDGSVAIDDLVEKPAPEDAPSCLSVVGRYVFGPGIFERLAQVTPGALGEIQLTDAMASLARDEGMVGLMIQGKRLDAGDTAGLFRASLHIAAETPEARTMILELARTLSD